MSEKKKVLTKGITLTLDFGGSLTKGVFQHNLEKKPRLLSMEPEIASMSAQSVANYFKDRIGNPDPEDSAWIGFDGQFRAIGHLASLFQGNAGLKELKYERAVYKILAAIWVAARKLRIKKPLNLDIYLAVLLPSSEYDDKDRFAQILKQAMGSFLTPDGEINANLAAFNCKPEGCGVYLAFERQLRKDSKHEAMPKPSSSISVVMLGYRNASILSSIKGQLSPGITSDLGFVQVVSAVRSKTSGLDEKMAISAIAKAGEKVEPSFLLRLCRSTTESGRAEDLRRLIVAIQDSRREYFQNVQSWLDNVMPTTTDILIFTGGTSEYFRQCFNLAEYYKLRGIRVFWHTDWEADFDVIKDFSNRDMIARFFDVYSFFMYFVNSYLPSNFRDKYD